MVGPLLACIMTIDLPLPETGLSPEGKALGSCSCLKLLSQSFRVTQYRITRIHIVDVQRPPNRWQVGCAKNPSIPLCLVPTQNTGGIVRHQKSNHIPVKPIIRPIGSMR